MAYIIIDQVILNVLIIFWLVLSVYMFKIHFF
jgi:hypothetical protein